MKLINFLDIKFALKYILVVVVGVWDGGGGLIVRYVPRQYWFQPHVFSERR
jgi:hypothetical protein